jgi:hypothetical protein
MSRVLTFAFIMIGLWFTSASVVAGSKIDQAGAVRIVAAIPEVKAWTAHIEKQSSGKSRAVLKPSESVSVNAGKAFWSVSFYEDNGSYLHLWQSFLVSVEDETVLIENVLDPYEGPLTLENWRKAESPLKGITK